MTTWWKLTIDQLEKELNTDGAKGLSNAEAAGRIAQYGKNELAEKKGESPWFLFFRQFNDFIIWVLIAAALVSGFLKEWLDTGVIVVIIIVNAVLGFIQEYRAERALAELKKLSSPSAKVLRDGTIQLIPGKELVPGDVVQLEAGDSVPADARVISAFYFRTQEASLTGESTPVAKDTEPVPEDTAPLAERTNMIYMGTSAVAGKATAVVTATGMETELGAIAELINKSAMEQTPLQKRLESLGKWLVYFCFGIVAVVFALGMFRGIPFLEMFLTSVSLAVAAIPEGLPAVVTIALALGVQRMVKRNALIRKLPSVETLGSTSVICTDKTGTLTQNQMTVRAVWAGGKTFTVSGTGYAPEGEFFAQGVPVKFAETASLMKVLEIGVLCNGAVLSHDAAGVWMIIGDPTEGSLLTAALKAGLTKDEREKRFPLTGEIPFDSQRKAMSVFRSVDGKTMVYTKGAPDVILDRSTMIDDNGTLRQMTEAERDEILVANEQFAGQALRVLAFAYRGLQAGYDVSDPAQVEKDLVFVGLQAMIDPPRPEVKDAMALCRQAGIESVMITGDHKNTAIAIARELGMLDDRRLAISGNELDAMSDEELTRRVREFAVYARVSAEHKLRIVRAWRNNNAVVAMTGDGVNDAPALREADIGIAMGITGTDVTKEAADMVITDDNFASIVSAVEEGRVIYQNILKFVYYLLSCNTGEVLVLFIASLLGWPIPLVPIQILWANLITDGLPALALGVDTAEPGLMQKPVNRSKGIIDASFVRRTVAGGVLIAACSLFAFAYVFFVEKEGLGRARTAAFVVLVCTQLFHSFNARSQRLSIFKLGFFSNKSLFYAVAVSLALQIAVVYVPFLQPVFKTVALSSFDWCMIAVLSSLPLWALEAVKLIRRR